MAWRQRMIDQVEGRVRPQEATPRDGYPGLWQQAKTLAVAAWKHTTDGFHMTTEEEREARLTICRACDRYDPEMIRCHECTCYLIPKTSWASEACPLGKWGVIVRDGGETPQPAVRTGCGSCGG